MKTVEVPKDAHQPGDVVQTSDGRFGQITFHGWDGEGAFGYFVSVDRGFSGVWVYHHRELEVYRRKE